MRILILGGGNGFIGWNLSKYFAQNPDNIIYSSFFQERKPGVKNVIYIYGDLTKREEVENLFNEAGPDIVILAAAYTTSSKDVVENPWKHNTTNSCMNPLVFEICHTHKIKHCIWFSCSTMYPSSPKSQKEIDWKLGSPITKQYQLVAAMKTYSEQLCEIYGNMGVCKYTAIRLSNVFGPGDKQDLSKAHFLPSIIKKISESKENLSVWGNPDSARRDFIFIDDVVSMVNKIIHLQKNNFELFNCGCGYSRSVGEVIDIVKEISGKNGLKVIYDSSKPNIPVDISLNCEKAKEILGWEPKIDFRDGLKRTLDFIE